MLHWAAIHIGYVLLARFGLGSDCWLAQLIDGRFRRMRLFGKLVTDLNESDLLSLRENKISENQILEFKRDLYTKSDRDKREFLKDVVGMANASGGRS